MLCVHIQDSFISPELWNEREAYEFPFSVTLLFFLACICAQLCLTLCDPMDCSLPVSSVHGISQARTLEWVVISYSRGSFRPRDQTFISCIGRQILYHCTTCKSTFLSSSLYHANFEESGPNPSLCLCCIFP